MSAVDGRGSRWCARQPCECRATPFAPLVEVERGCALSHDAIDGRNRQLPVDHDPCAPLHCGNVGRVGGFYEAPPDDLACLQLSRDPRVGALHRALVGQSLAGGGSPVGYRLGGQPSRRRRVQKLPSGADRHRPGEQPWVRGEGYAEPGARFALAPRERHRHVRRVRERRRTRRRASDPLSYVAGWEVSRP